MLVLPLGAVWLFLHLNKLIPKTSASSAMEASGLLLDLLNQGRLLGAWHAWQPCSMTASLPWQGEKPVSGSWMERPPASTLRPTLHPEWGCRPPTWEAAGIPLPSSHSRRGSPAACALCPGSPALSTAVLEAPSHPALSLRLGRAEAAYFGKITVHVDDPSHDLASSPAFSPALCPSTAARSHGQSLLLVTNDTVAWRMRIQAPSPRQPPPCVVPASTVLHSVQFLQATDTPLCADCRPFLSFPPCPSLNSAAITVHFPFRHPQLLCLWPFILLWPTSVLVKAGHPLRPQAWSECGQQEGCPLGPGQASISAPKQSPLLPSQLSRIPGGKRTPFVLFKPPLPLPSAECSRGNGNRAPSCSHRHLWHQPTFAVGHPRPSGPA
nr:uncharacterized protein LOC123276440 isoform X1 [Equus asinus]